jgi:hypothetical protein
MIVRMPDAETLTLRATVIAGKRYDDDFTVIWRGMSIGRIMQASGVPAHLAQWSWNCSVHGKPGASANGSGTDLDDCKAKFKAAWTAIRAGLSEDDIASAREYAESSREALARYDRKQRR